MRPGVADDAPILALTTMNCLARRHPLKILRTSQPRDIRRLVHIAAAPDNYDVVIIGGGPAGLALATALGAHLRA
jgi:NADPH-dependent 2,4-dienoyl-CoA reductase/sulfur reductase-like enzyme